MIIDGGRLMAQDREGITKVAKPSVVERRGDLGHRCRKRRIYPEANEADAPGFLAGIGPFKT